MEWLDYITNFGSGALNLLAAIFANVEFGSFFFGFMFFLLVFCVRALRDDDFDTSNLLNPIRVLSEIGAHISWVGKSFYLSAEQKQILENAGLPPKRVFPYISGDEFSDHFPESRPPDDAI